MYANQHYPCSGHCTTSCERILRVALTVPHALVHTYKRTSLYFEMGAWENVENVNELTNVIIYEHTRHFSRRTTANHTHNHNAVGQENVL